MQKVIVFNSKDVARFMVHVVRMETLLKMNLLALEHVETEAEVAEIMLSIVRCEGVRATFLGLIRRAEKQGVPAPTPELVAEVLTEMEGRENG